MFNLISANFHHNGIEEIPNSITNLTNLTHLYLWNNNLTEIPGFIGDMDLTHLRAENNDIETVDNNINNISTLTYLSIQGNIGAPFENISCEGITTCSK